MAFKVLKLAIKSRVIYGFKKCAAKLVQPCPELVRNILAPIISKNRPRPVCHRILAHYLSPLCHNICLFDELMSIRFLLDHFLFYRIKAATRRGFFLDGEIFMNRILPFIISMAICIPGLPYLFPWRLKSFCQRSFMRHCHFWRFLCAYLDLRGRPA